MYITTDRHPNHANAIYVNLKDENCFTYHGNCNSSTCLIYKTCTDTRLNLPDFTGDFLLKPDDYPELFI